MIERSLSLEGCPPSQAVEERAIFHNEVHSCNRPVLSARLSSCYSCERVTGEAYKVPQFKLPGLGSVAS